MESRTSAEQILDNIFTIMQRLLNEMRLSENGENKHVRVFDIFADLGRTLTGADRASFWRWDKREHRLVTAAATGTDQIVIEDTVGLVGRALRENRPLVVNDPYHHPDFNTEVDKQTGYVTKSVLVMPVSNCRGEVIGAFQAINKCDDAGFDEEEDTKRLSIAALICGMALESDLFLADSQRDRLTELKNRFGFQSDSARYQRLLHASKRPTPLSIIMCDIDFFKAVNDTYGHNAGDAALIHIAQLLRSRIRACDNAYRWGGEEFILIMEGMVISEAKSMAEEIRQAVMESACRFEGQAIQMTMSFGCAQFDPSLSMKENIQVADKRLYRAKATGRNRVVSDDSDASES